MIPLSAYERSLQEFLKPIASLLADASVSEIMINHANEIYAERKGQLTRCSACFPSNEALTRALRNIAQYLGRSFDDEHPILEGHLPDGSRIEALLPPIAAAGPAVAIRRFSRNKLTLPRLIEVGALSFEAARFLGRAVADKKNIIIAGGTGSGKTSLLNALSGLIAPTERVIVLEDARELQLQGEHVLQLGVRPKDSAGRGEVTMRDLFKATLRLRPDRIVIGEIRGGESLDLIQAMTSGHGGCLSTVHASHPCDALARLETMALMSDVRLPLHALRSQIASAIDLVVQITRHGDGRRGITHICKVEPCTEGGDYKLHVLFELGQSGALTAAAAQQGNLAL
ncbi:MAG TPA: CpaF family protein [Polyangiaceae bacterium]|jgi:pilus assembly protein CpaF|nr:CpaF family protein [Polyangiaceae bacterium]